MDRTEATSLRRTALDQAQGEARTALVHLEQAGSEAGGTAASTAISYLDAGQYANARTFTIIAGGIEKDAATGMESEAGFAHRAIDRCCAIEVQIACIDAGLEPDPIPTGPGQRFGVRGGTSVFDPRALACVLGEHAETFDRWRGRPRLEDLPPLRAVPDAEPAPLAVVSNAGPVIA